MKQLTTEKILFAVVLIFILAVFPARADGPDAAFRFPVRAYNDGNFRVAIRGFSDFIDQFPDHERVPHALFWKGEARRHLDKQEEAYETLLELRRRTPDFQPDMVMPRLAYLAQELGREEKVMDEITERLLQEAPELQDYLVRWRIQRNEESALAAQLSALPPGRLTATAADFLEHYKQETALVDLQEKLNKGVWTAEIFQQMRRLPEVTRRNLILSAGRELFMAEDFRQLVNFGTSVPSDWKSPGFFLLYGEAALEVGDHSLAEEIYRELLEEPDYRKEAHFNLAWLLNEQENKSEALQVLQRLNWQQHTELNARALRLKGDLLLHQNRPSDAIEFYRRASEISKEPGFRNETRYWLGWSYLEVDMIRRAYEVFNTVRAAGNIRLSEIFQVRGRTSLELGKYDEAEHNYSRALDHALTDELKLELRYELAQTYYEWGRLEEAYDLLLELHEKELPARLRPPVRLSLGRAAVEMGKPDLGWSVLRSAEKTLIAEFPEEFRYFAGEAALEAGHTGYALEYFDQLARQFPDSRFVRPALRMGFRAELARLNEEELEEEENIRQIINQSPADLRPEMLREWARVEKDRDSLDRARGLYEELLEEVTDPSQVGVALAGIVEVDLQQDMPERAEDFLALKLEELPDHPRVAGAVYRLINYYYDIREIEQVKKWADKYLDKFAVSPEHPRVFFILAEIDRRETNLKAAREQYRQALEQTDSLDLEARALFRLGELDLAEEIYEDAYENFQAVKELRPAFVSVDRLEGLLAEAAIGFENFQLAGSHLDEIEELADDQLIYLARVHYHRENYEQADSILKEIELEEDSPLQPERLFWQGRVARETGDYERAENVWYRLLYLYPEWEDRDELIFHLADLLRSQGEIEEAESLKEKLASEYPDSEYLEAF